MTYLDRKCCFLQRSSLGIHEAAWVQSERLSPEAANVLLLNTCSIREKAEQKVRLSLHAALPLPYAASQPVHGGGGWGGGY